MSPRIIESTVAAEMKRAWGECQEIDRRHLRRETGLKPRALEFYISRVGRRMMGGD